MKKFLLIDDIAERQEKYCQFFDFLEIEYLRDKPHLDLINLSEYSGFILDVLYSEPAYKDITFDYVVDKLPPGKPVYIISADWQKVMLEKKNEKISQLLRNGQILAILSWKNIETELANNSTSSKDFAQTSWIVYNDLCDDKIADDESLLVLQISDLEFGNPEQNPFIKVAREDFLNDIREDMNQLGNKKYIDFLVICGDITFNGSKEQFDKAKDWLSVFTGELIREGGDKRKRILMVPGNHDINLSSLLGNYRSILFNKDKKKFVIDDNDPVNSLYTHIGFNNYAHFLHDITLENSMLLDPGKPVICRRFENIGVNFILLNSINFTGDMQHSYKMDDEYISGILKEARNMGPDVCNIVVSHVAPEKINAGDPTSTATNRVIKSLISAIKPKLWLFGHDHDGILIDDRRLGDGDEKTCLVRARALMLKSGGVCDDATSGYTLLNLIRRGSKVEEIKYLKSDPTYGRINKTIFTPFISR